MSGKTKGAVLGAVALLLGLVVWWKVGRGEEAAEPGAAAEPVIADKVPAPKRPTRGQQGGAPSFDVLLDDDPVGSLRLEGQVVTAKMEPVAGAVVSLDANPPRSVRSNESGEFVFDKLVGRPYRVVARTDDGFAGPVTVRLTETNDPVILTLRDATSARVVVRSATDGKGIAGAKVELRSIGVAEASTDADGVAVVRGIAVGRYQVMAVAEGYAPDHSFLRVPTNAKEIQHEVELRRGAPVSGIVVTAQGKPVAGARVTYEGASNWAQSADSRYDAVLTDAAGKFRIDALPAGSFRFVARADGHAPGTSEITTLNGTSEPGLVRIVVDTGATLAGSVVSKDGQPAPGARVRVQVKTEGFRWNRARQVYSDDKGRFEMGNLPAKPVEVAALHDLGSSEVTELELSPKGPNEVTLELANDGVISGIVVDSADEPIEGAQVSAWPSFGRGRRGRRGGRSLGVGFSQELSDAGGRFVLRGLEDGDYSLRASPPGAPGRGRLWFREEVEAKVGDKDVRIVLPADGSIKGKVAFDNGQAPEAFTVGIGFGAPTPFSTRDGSFELTDLPPRNYSLVIRGVGFDDKRVSDIDVEAGKAADIGTVNVVRGRRLAGRVVDKNGSGVEGALIRAGRNIFGDGSSSKAQFGPPWARNAKETRSSEDGEFVISGLGPGNLSVVAEHEESGRSIVVAVGPRDDGTQLMLALQPFGALQGTVRKGGEPLASVIVQASMVASPQVAYGVSTGEDGTYRFDRLGPGTYKVSAMTNQGRMRGFGFFRKEVVVESERIAKVDLDVEPGGVTLEVALKPENRDATGFAFVRVVRGELDAKTARELEMAVAAAPSDIAFQAFSIRGQPASVQGLSAGTYTVCATVFPTDVTGMADTIAYMERQGDSLPAFCDPAQLSEQAEQSFTLPVVVPDYVPDSDS